MTSQDRANIMLREHQAARSADFRLAIVRSEMLKDFHEGVIAQGFDALTANELTHSHAKYLDGDYEADLQVLRQVMERS